MGLVCIHETFGKWNSKSLETTEEMQGDQRDKVNHQGLHDNEY